MTATDSNISF